MASVNQRQAEANTGAAAKLSDSSSKAALIDFLFQLADDDLTIGHRDSEWLGVAPDIEEDVAFSSIAQDEVGHATLYYGMLRDLGVGTADELAFQRSSSERRSAWLVEQDNGDWAYSVVRHYLYDVFEDVRLTACMESCYEPLRWAAAKIRREEYYHLLHGETQFKYLALGGAESLARVQTALKQTWMDLPNLFDLGVHADQLVASGIVSCDAHVLRARFEAHVLPELRALGLQPPKVESAGSFRRSSHHIPQLDNLLSVLREVVDLDSAAAW